MIDAIGKVARKGLIVQDGYMAAFLAVLVLRWF
jgi:hypothetical protein